MFHDFPIIYNSRFSIAMVDWLPECRIHWSMVKSSGTVSPKKSELGQYVSPPVFIPSIWCNFVLYSKKPYYFIILFDEISTHFHLTANQFYWLYTREIFQCWWLNHVLMLPQKTYHYNQPTIWAWFLYHPMVINWGETPTTHAQKPCAPDIQPFRACAACAPAAPKPWGDVENQRDVEFIAEQ